jgi:hypothetical protein
MIVNRRKWILFSVVSNVALVAMAAYLQLSRNGSNSHSPPIAPRTRAQAPRIVASPQPVVVPMSSEPVPQPFQWSQLESEDFRIYCANLRAVGCPEKTIVDILLPFIEESYAGRLAKLKVASPESFWLNRSQPTAASRQRERDARQIQKEKAALIQELFGKPLDIKALQVWHREITAGMSLGFLSEGKPEQVVCVVKKYADEANEIRRSARDILTPEDIGALHQLYDKCRNEMMSVLAPAELEELELRMTAVGLASMLRESVLGLVGLEVSGSEIRNVLAQVARSGNAALRGLLMEITPAPEEKNQLRQSVETQMRSMLGDTRFTHYQRMQDQVYQKLFHFGEEHSLPTPTVGKVYEVYLAVKEEENKIRKDQELTAKQREEAVAQARQSSENVLQGLLGERIFEDLKKGRWP